MSEFPIEEALKPECDALRADLLAIEKRVRVLRQALHDKLPGETPSPEVYANQMLAVRHVEDARMRIGKMLQHARDGVSILDRKGTE